MTDKYSYRLDGNFLIRCECQGCGQQFDAHALSNAYGGTYCGPCDEMHKWQTRLDEADNLLEVREMYSEFSAESDNRKAIKFTVTCIVVVGCALIGWATVILIFGGFNG